MCFVFCIMAMHKKNAVISVQTLCSLCSVLKCFLQQLFKMKTLWSYTPLCDAAGKNSCLDKSIGLKMSSAFQAWSESRIYKYLLFYPCLKVLLWYFQLYFQCEQNSSELNTMWKQRKRILQSQVTFDHKRSRYINGLLANPLCLQRICSSAPQHVQACEEVGHNRKKKKHKKSTNIRKNRKQQETITSTQYNRLFSQLFFFTLAFLPALDSYSLVIRDTHFSSLFPRALFTIQLQLSFSMKFLKH